MKKHSVGIAVLVVLVLVLAPGLVAEGLQLTDKRMAPEMPELIAPAGIQPGLAVRSALDELLYEYSVFELPTASIDRQVRETGRLRIHLGNQTFDLELEPSDLRGEGYREVLMTAAGEVTLAERPLSTFKGTVVGDPDSIVRLTVLPDLFEGYIKTDEEWIFLDPVTNYGSAEEIRGLSGAVVLYREGDVRPEAVGKCGAGALEHDLHRLGQVAGTATDGLSSHFEASHIRRTLQVATDGDGQLFQRYGNPGLFNFMSGVLNRVDGLYNTLNIDVVISFQQGWSNPSTDPYTSLNASTTLNQLQSWWNANRGNINRDTVHQFSGKDMSGGTIGIAYVGVVCNAPTFAYGLSEDQQNTVLNGRLTAHELGHNLSASHDSSGCANCNGTGPIMCSFIQTGGTDTWSNCSRNSIGNHVDNNGSCMN